MPMAQVIIVLIIDKHVYKIVIHLILFILLGYLCVIHWNIPRYNKIIFCYDDIPLCKFQKSFWSLSIKVQTY